MKKALGAFVVAAFAVACVFWFEFALQKQRSDAPGRTHPAAADHFFDTYVDPATGTIPARINERVAEYVATLPRQEEVAGKRGRAQHMWIEAGPFNVGGRVKAFALDVTNTSTVIAGGVSGGIWKSTDAGNTWQLKSRPDEHKAVSAIAQDTRQGHTSTWYYGAGEWRGSATASDRGARAPFNGSGIFRSTDGGETWQVLPATADANPVGTSNPFDYVVRIVVSETTGTIFVACNQFGIYRSQDGGATFTRVLGGQFAHTWSDVRVGTDGTAVAVLSQANLGGSQLNSPGVYKSTDDGATWINITPSDFPTTHLRSVVGLSESNPDVAFVLTDVASAFVSAPGDARLHRIKISDGSSTNLSGNLPKDAASTVGSPSRRIMSLAGFCLTIAVKPDDENYIVVGGVNLFRSTDGFATSIDGKDSDQIGGYATGTATLGRYGNHHPDNHLVVFNPENPDEMWSAHDGGISVTNDAGATPLRWQTKSRGLNITQFYSVAMSANAGDRKIIGGTQDNGTQLFLDERSTGGTFSDARSASGGDGGYSYVGDNFVYTIAEGGQQFLFRLEYTGPTKTRVRNPVVITPPGSPGIRFVNPWDVDPVDERIIYFAGGNTIWRANNAEVGSGGWTRLSSIAAPPGFSIGAIGVSTTPAHVVYFGANDFTGAGGQPRLYRFAESNTATDGLVDISIPQAAPGSYIHGIAVNPLDANEIVVAMSNYNITGIFHSVDGGANYTPIEGNLTGTPALPGPSIRDATILPIPDNNETLYFVGTSAGLFTIASEELDGPNTEWQQVAPEKLGNVVVENVKSRVSDGRVLAGTHGRGVFVGDLDPRTVSVESESPEAAQAFSVYPLPASSIAIAEITQSTTEAASLEVLDVTGRVVIPAMEINLISGINRVPVDIGSLANGNYFVRVSSASGYQVGKMVVAH